MNSIYFSSFQNVVPLLSFRDNLKISIGPKPKKVLIYRGRSVSTVNGTGSACLTGLRRLLSRDGIDGSSSCLVHCGCKRLVALHLRVSLTPACPGLTWGTGEGMIPRRSEGRRICGNILYVVYCCVWRLPESLSRSRSGGRSILK